VTVPAYLGRVWGHSAPVGTCFQIAPGVLVTAWHVLDQLGLGQEGAKATVDGWAGSVPQLPAQVVRVDPLHDLAVLRREVPLPGTVAGLVATESVPLLTDVVVTGVAEVDDPGRSYDYLDATGVWQGGTMRDQQVPLGRMVASGVVPGMSGAPVRRLSDDLVVGVVCQRYNSADGWLQHSVWIAGTEQLARLLPGVAQVEVAEASLGLLADLLLSVSGATVRLSGAGVDVSAPHGGVSPGLANAVHEVQRARARSGGTRSQPVAQQATAGVSLRRAGQLLADSFLPTPVSNALARLLRRAEREHAAVRIGVDAGGLGWLPWEALPDPASGQPLALHPLVALYRKVPAGSPPGWAGPLRLVVAISSPQTGGGAVLDYEQELRNVLSAVRGARQGEASVSVVPFATTEAIRAALAGGGVHLLHLSAHGNPGALALEDADGGKRMVDAATFLAEAVPAGAMPPVVALAACYTDVPAGDGAASFASQLAARGAAAVIATETSVTDRYATRLFARIYAELAQAATPDVVRAVADARRTVQNQLDNSPDERDRQIAALDEWSVVTVLAAAPAVAVYDPAAPPQTIPAPATRQLPGLLVRPAGGFVGRRREQHQLPVELVTGSTHAGIVLHGIGGVGKSTLAAELATHARARQPALRVKVLSGQLNVDGLLSGIAGVLRQHLLATGQHTAGPAVQVVDVAGRLDVPWGDRWALLYEHALPQVPVLLVLDNFEDNLTAAADGSWQVAEPAVGGLLAAVASGPGRVRMLVTSRYPFTLPAGAEERLRWCQLGPLSYAETLKLVWQLPNLDRLDDDQLHRVWRLVGGHPRTLEYLDALLAGGTGRYPDITTRLADAVRRRLGRADGERWLSQQRVLDAALADVVTLAADDVLLSDHLARLDQLSGAARLLLGAAVYREPVDVNALLFQLGEPDDNAGHTPDRAAALQRVAETLNVEPDRLDQDTIDAALNPATSQFETAQREQLANELRQLSEPPRPPRSTTIDIPALVDRLAATSLLSVNPQTGTVFVHRWTAAEFERLRAELGRTDQLHQAHHRAADYWRWRHQVWPQGRQADVHDLLEARHHLLQVGDIDSAGTVTEWVCSQLQTWGAWDHETDLIHEMLPHLPPDHPRRSAYLHELGNLAHRRGEHAEAERLYRQSLAINERLGDQAGMATSYHQLGMLAQDRGDLAEAERLYRQSLTINQELGDQAGMAASYGQLGRLAQDRGDPAEAERLYRQSLAINERLGNQAGIAGSYHQLGRLAQDRGDLAEAERLYRQSLTIKERLGNQAGMATSYHQLGILAQNRGDPAEAERLYRQSLTIKERLGDQAGMAASYGQLGILAQNRGDPAEAERLYRQSLSIDERLGNQAGIAGSYHQLGMLAQARGDLAEAERLYRQSLSIDERLGNQAGIAGSYHQLGRLAQDRADPAEAERLYRQSLSIDERLGNQAGMATSLNQLGNLFVGREEPEIAVGLHARAFAIRLRLGAPEAGRNVRVLGELRSRLGEDAFRARAGEVLDQQSVENLVALIAEHEQASAGPGQGT
jgi:tetratricopeptide (TPR) repeat protein